MLKFKFLLWLFVTSLLLYGLSEVLGGYIKYRDYRAIVVNGESGLLKFAKLKQPVGAMISVPSHEPQYPVALTLTTSSGYEINLQKNLELARLDSLKKDGFLKVRYSKDKPQYPRFADEEVDNGLNTFLRGVAVLAVTIFLIMFIRRSRRNAS